MKLMKEKENKIEKSKNIIKKEKEKIKAEGRKQRLEKLNKTKVGRFILKIFTPKKKEIETSSLKEQIFSMIYFELIGAGLCLLILFALSGGRNYIKLYKDLNKLINAYDTIQSNYYGELNKDELVDKAIDSMVNSIGDSYTRYADKKEADNLLEDLEGTYQGIGCMVSMNEQEQIVVINVFGDGPAKLAGLQEGDIITKIDNQDFKDKTSEDMANYVKQNNSSKIKLTIIREGVEKELTISRKKVEVPSVTSQLIERDNKKIGYIDITIFSSVTYDQFKNQLEKLEKQKIEGLIIDVRNDTGGYLSAVTDISSLFLKKGQIIYQLEQDKKTEKIKDKTSEKRTYPIAVLINGTSASASEILASAIKESYGGIIVGTRSYGKGTVQKTKVLPDGSMLKYTIQHWLTPNGNWINEKGVEPTIEVDLNFEENIDNQLETAINEIIK